MPRKAIDYQKVIIYKLVCNDLSVKDLYVGHTTDFTNRKKLHKSRCLNSNDSRHNLKVYKLMRENGNWYNWSMIEIEKYPCNDENEARSRERYWYEVLNANMNTYKPMIDIIEIKQNSKAYYVQNKDRILEYYKDYYDQNKDKILEYHKEFYVQNKDKIGEKCKSYRDRNKDKISEKCKIYRDINKDKIKQKNNEKHQCKCGGFFTIVNKSHHSKTKKHLKYIQENESN